MLDIDGLKLGILLQSNASMGLHRF